MTKEDVKMEEDMSPEELKELNEAEDFITNFKEEDLDDPDKVEDLTKKLKAAQTTIHQKRHYREKFQEADKALKEKDPKEKKPVNPPEPTGKEGKPAGETENKVDPYIALEFRQDHPELSKAAVKEIIDYAGLKKISPEEALKLPVMKSLIKDLENTEDIEGASIVPGRKGASGGGGKDWSSATQAEIDAERNRIQYGS